MSIQPSGRQRTLEERDARALTEVMTVEEDVGRVSGCEEMFLVTSGSGSTYLVDMQLGSCECWDSRTRTGGCKHVRRVAFATGRRPIPAWADREAIDDQLGLHVDGDVDYQHFDRGVGR